MTEVVASPDKTTEVKLYNVNDGLTGRDGGPYLDRVEMHNAETQRAAVEGRDPDYNNLQPTAGVQLVSAGVLINNAGANNVPSQDGSGALAAMVDLAAENTDFPVVSVASVVGGIDPGAGEAPVPQEDNSVESGSDINPTGDDVSSDSTVSTSGSSTAPVSSEPIPFPENPPITTS